jgi:hypothetical protein
MELTIKDLRDSGDGLDWTEDYATYLVRPPARLNQTRLTSNPITSESDPDTYAQRLTDMSEEAMLPLNRRRGSGCGLGCAEAQLARLPGPSGLHQRDGLPVPSVQLFRVLRACRVLAALHQRANCHLHGRALDQRAL